MSKKSDMNQKIIQVTKDDISRDYDLTKQCNVTCANLELTKALGYKLASENAFTVLDGCDFVDVLRGKDKLTFIGQAKRMYPDILTNRTISLSQWINVMDKLTGKLLEHSYIVYVYYICEGIKTNRISQIYCANKYTGRSPGTCIDNIRTIYEYMTGSDIAFEILYDKCRFTDLPEYLRNRKVIG